MLQKNVVMVARVEGREYVELIGNVALIGCEEAPKILCEVFGLAQHRWNEMHVLRSSGKMLGQNPLIGLNGYNL